MKFKSIIIAVLFVACSSVCAFAELTVAVAANLQYTFEELKTEFQKETGIHIKSVIGSSGRFTAQIENGAPFDLFLSADMSYPEAIYEEGLAVDKPRVYAYGALILWSTKEGIDLSLGLEALKNPAIKKIAIANPKTAPYGRQAVNAFKYFKLYPAVEKKLVYAESIAQVNQFVVSGAADVGVTAKSVVLAENMKGKGQWREVEASAYEPIAQGVVILKYAQNGNFTETQKFYDFLFSDAAGTILKKYGYGLP